jgi:tetratricopeptide (TPR) repeat protein
MIAALAGWWITRGGVPAFGIGVLGAVVAFIPDLVGRMDRRAAFRRDEQARQTERQVAADALAGPATSRTAAGLLRAEYRCIPFVGRDEELAALTAWCLNAEAVPVCMLLGPGGVGKSRLAAELLRRVEGDWAGHHVGPGQERDALMIARAATAGPVVLILDYAETRTDGLEALLRDVAALSEQERANCRVLLIARARGEWWDRLRYGAGSAAVRALLTGVEPITLLLDTRSGLSAAEMTALAVTHFAKELDVVVPQQWSIRTPQEPVPVLVLHAAALVVVLRERNRLAGEPALSDPLTADNSILGVLLSYEGYLWEKSRPAELSTLPVRGWLRAVALASLVAPSDEEDALALLQRVPELTEGGDIRRGTAWWLRQIYPPGDGGAGWWGWLVPDPVAEHLVCEVFGASPWLIKAFLVGLGARDADRAMTVLSRADAHHPGAEQIMRTALNADFSGLSVAAARAAIRQGGSLVRNLPSTIATASGTLDDFVRLVESIPYPTTALAAAHREAVRRAAAALPDDAEAADRARWNDILSVVMHQSGHAYEARIASERAVAAYRDLVKVDRARHLDALARSLVNLGTHQSGAQALKTTREAVALYSELCDVGHDRYQFELAQARANFGALAIRLNPGPGLDASRKAVASLRALLAANDEERYRVGLAQALATFGAALLAAQQPAQALPRSREAVELYRQLAETDADRYVGSFASALSSLEKVLSCLGQAEEALAAAQEALTLHRSADALRLGGRSGMAREEQSNIAHYLIELDRPVEAAEAVSVAVNELRVLAQSMPRIRESGKAYFTAPDPDWVDPDRGLRWLIAEVVHAGYLLIREARHREALRPLLFALETYQGLIEHKGFGMLTDTWPSIERLGLNRGNAAFPDGSVDDILLSWAPPRDDPTSREQRLSRYAWLAVAYPPAYLAELASGLAAVSLSTAGETRGFSPLDAAEEAASIYRILHCLDANEFTRPLADSLERLASICAQSGDSDLSDHARSEAETLRRSDG